MNDGDVGNAGARHLQGIVVGLAMRVVNVGGASPTGSLVGSCPSHIGDCIEVEERGVLASGVFRIAGNETTGFFQTC